MKKVFNSFLLAFAIILQMGMVSYAQDAEIIYEGKDILQVVVLYIDEAGEEHFVQKGSGFLIGETGTPAEYLITAKQVTSISEEMAQQISVLYTGIESVKDIECQVKVVIQRDVMIAAQLVSESEEMGFSIWRLEQPIYDREGMVLSQDAQKSIGYLKYNTSSGVDVQGRPLLNEKGAVVALAQSVNTIDAVSISEIIPVLDALGIPYTTYEQRMEQKKTEFKLMGDLVDFQNGIAIAEYEDKMSIQEIGIAVAISIVVLVIFVLIIGKITKKSRMERKRKKQQEFEIVYEPPVFTDVLAPKENYKQLIEQSVQLSAPQSKKKVEDYTGMPGKTMNYRTAGSDTMVLHAEEMEQFKYAYLIRRSNGESIPIKEKEFVLGKEPSQTDYCLSGNSAISRVHAVILHKGTKYDVADKNATNGTFVNGIRVAAFQKEPLRNGDILRLADEEFEFRNPAE